MSAMVTVRGRPISLLQDCGVATTEPGSTCETRSLVLVLPRRAGDGDDAGGGRRTGQQVVSQPAERLEYVVHDDRRYADGPVDQRDDGTLVVADSAKA